MKKNIQLEPDMIIRRIQFIDTSSNRNNRYFNRTQKIPSSPSIENRMMGKVATQKSESGKTQATGLIKIDTTSSGQAKMMFSTEENYF